MASLHDWRKLRRGNPASFDGLLKDNWISMDPDLGTNKRAAQCARCGQDLPPATGIAHDVWFADGYRSTRAYRCTNACREEVR